MVNFLSIFSHYQFHKFHIIIINYRWPIDGFSNFDVEITNFSSHVQLPAGVFSMSLNIKNSFSTDLKDCQVVVSMREIDSGLMSRNKNPIFQVNFSVSFSFSYS